MKKKRKANTYEISEGNLIVLEKIPKMMQDPILRKKLREMVIDFMLTEEVEGLE